jgi:hypothetical protein
MYKLILERRISKKVNEEKILAQIDYIIKRALASSRGKTWKSTSRALSTTSDKSGYCFQYEINFKKSKGQLGSEAEYKQWQQIKAMVEQSGSAAKYGESPWKIIEDSSNNTSEIVSESEKTAVDVKEVQPLEKVKTWSDLTVPNELLGQDSDLHLKNHPAWANLYGVNPQIRVILSNIKRAHETNGDSRNHAVLFGHAGCGKTTTMFCIEKMFGSGAVLKLDATSTTKAGIEKLFFSDLSEIPPLVFMEEAEKADPEALKIWLGALDDRGEIRKVNFRVNQLRAIKVLFICTVNNKALFDKMMGSDGSEAGALSSRCVTQVYYPRPTELILQQILEKEIKEKGGNPAWIGPAIEMAGKLNVTDPRIVRSYLAGGDRLLDGTYQKDWYAIQDAAKKFNN